MTLVSTILDEVEQLLREELHPKVTSLVSAFVAYLKVPRYQNPLTISELASLFEAFSNDLKGLVFNIYAQLTLCKRQLIQKSPLFANDLQSYDYLNAIAHYSPSHIKLVRRTDPQAAYQLRIFAFYKAITIIRTIQGAQVQLFLSVTPGDRTELYYKIFRFDLRDLSIQDLLAEKLVILRRLDLPISAFCESGFKADSASLDEYFLTLSKDTCQSLEKIKSHMSELDQAKTPDLKLHFIAKIQKSLIDLCAGYYNNDSSKVNNDLLLPALIYIIIYHPPQVDKGKEIDLYLNFTFTKKFCQIVDPYNITSSAFALNSSLSSYAPTEQKETYRSRSEKAIKHNFFELINLRESNDVIYEKAEPEFQSDKALINYLQRTSFNAGELQYYLTNFEAILYFLINTPITDIVPEGYFIPEQYLENDIVILPLYQVLEARESKNEVRNDTNEKIQGFNDLADNDDTARSRSSSLFNTISAAVSQSVNRSRSNSTTIKTHNRESSLPSFEASLSSSLPLGDTYRLTPMKKFLGRLGQASGINLNDQESGSTQEGEESETRKKRSLSLFDVFSQSQPRIRSGSTEIPSFLHSSNLRKPTITTKLLNGVTELITKFNVAANASSHTLSNYGDIATHYTASSREDSLEDYSMNQKAPPVLNDRTSSMDKWFNNLGEPGDIQTCTNSQMDSAYNEGSLFSSSFEELTKYHHLDFDSLTMKDLRDMKNYYDQLCLEFLAMKSDLKTSIEYLPTEEINKEQQSI